MINLPPMGNAEDLIASAWGRTSVRPFFFRLGSRRRGRWRSVSDRKDKQAVRRLSLFVVMVYITTR